MCRQCVCTWFFFQAEDGMRYIGVTGVQTCALPILDAVSDAHATGPGHDWQLDLPEEPVTVTGDGARLHQVLANLLANARTHTAEGTTVTVGVRATGYEAVLTVTDGGPGIPADLQPHVFERFARGDGSRSRAAGSPGLGLSIVQAVVTAPAGTVAVASVPGRTEFTVRLPFHPATLVRSSPVSARLVRHRPGLRFSPAVTAGHHP